VALIHNRQKGRIAMATANEIAAPSVITRDEFGVGDSVPVFLRSQGRAADFKVALKAPAGIKVRRLLSRGLLRVPARETMTRGWEIAAKKPGVYELIIQVEHTDWCWNIEKKVTAFDLHRLGYDPTVAFCMIRYHDDEEEYLEPMNWPEGLFYYKNEYPLKRALRDFHDCGINTLVMTGSTGSMIKENYIETHWFRKYVTNCHEQGIRVGVCVPFADTYDNYITSRLDPDAQQRNHLGKLMWIGGRLAVTEMNAPPFMNYAQRLIRKSAGAGIDIIDYAEPDYWPARTTGHNPYIRRRWAKTYRDPFPKETNFKHRLFLENCRIETLTDYSNYIHSFGLVDHLTASPFGHFPNLICQNYGKYSLTPITELSSTYHNTYGRLVVNRLNEAGIKLTSPYKADGIGCLEVKFMGDWNKRHAVYIGCNAGIAPAEYRNRINECAFLHNMDLFLWEYPGITGRGKTPNISRKQTRRWRETKQVFRERFGVYLNLPAEYHQAAPSPTVFLTISKRMAYIDRRDWVTNCMYRQGVRLVDAHLPFGIIWPEFPDPLLERNSPVKVLVLSEHAPMSDGFVKAVRKWLSRGRTLIYFGGPGYDWLTGKRLKTLPRALRDLLADGKDDVTKTTLSDFLAGQGRTLPDGESNPEVTSAATGEGGLLLHADLPGCQMSDTAYALLVATAAEMANARPLALKTNGDIETYVHQNGKTIFVSLLNHGQVRTKFTVAYKLKVHKATIEEIISKKRLPGKIEKGIVSFGGYLGAEQPAIFRIGNYHTGDGGG